MHHIKWLYSAETERRLIIILETLIGFISGIVSGTGMGGGTILILCLSLFMGIDQKVAQATNLVFFIPTSIAAIYINIKEKKIEWKTAKVVIVWGIIGAVTGALIALKVNVKILKKLFGIFLAVIAIHEIYILIKEYKKDKKNNNK